MIPAGQCKEPAVGCMI